MAENSYIKTNWVNNVTKLNADNMNHIENGIEALYTAISDDSEPETIVRRNVNGQIIIADPTADNHAATKKYIDEKIAASITNVLTTEV